jgi:hypothetical protein
MESKVFAQHPVGQALEVPTTGVVDSSPRMVEDNVLF